MTANNPDNVGGLRDALDFVNRQPCRCMSIAQLGERDYCDRCRAVASIKSTELCRAAPAGGDVCATCQGHGMIGWTTGQTPEQFDQHEAPCPDCSAPAGSGEVSDWMLEMFDEVYEREWDRAADEADDRQKAIIGPADRHATRVAIAAILRKLQQGAECRHEWRDSEDADSRLPNTYIQQCAKCGVRDET